MQWDISGLGTAILDFAALFFLFIYVDNDDGDYYFLLFSIFVFC